MRDIFSTFEAQGRYILRLLVKNTDIKKVCQICGKPAELKNNRKSPYEIQLICKDCKKVNPINPETGMYDFPTINIKEHLITPIILNKNIVLTNEYINKINDILLGGYTRQEAVKHLGVTTTVYNKLIDEYKKQFDSNVEIKLEESYRRRKSYKAMNTRAKKRPSKNNNLYELKLKRHMTNKDIYDKVGITNATLCSISNGTKKPKNTTCALLAESLDCSIYDIFPSYTEFNDVHNIDDLIILMTEVHDKIYFIWQASDEIKYGKFLHNLSSKTNIRYEPLRNFILSTKYNTNDIDLNLLNNENIKSINKIYDEYNKVCFEYNTDKAVQFKEWEDKSKLRKRYL